MVSECGTSGSVVVNRRLPVAWQLYRRSISDARVLMILLQPSMAFLLFDDRLHFCVKSEPHSIQNRNSFGGCLAVLLKPRGASDKVEEVNMLLGQSTNECPGISSGTVEELELDSFGLSIIPSSLVSTYSLLVEDVLVVVSDAVVVHEAAALRIRRLSKGFLGNQNAGISVDDVEDYDSEQTVTYGHVSRRKSFRRKNPNQREWDNEDNWELPMDYL